MNEIELRNHIIHNYPQENERCEWKEFKSLKHSVAGRKGDDIVTYISAIANMDGGHLVIGVEDETLKIIGIQDFNEYSIENIKFRIVGNCTNLDSDKFKVEECITSDTNKTVWVFHIPKHPFRLAVYAHKKAWQRIDDNLVEITPARLSAIINETITLHDWSAQIVPNATINDLDVDAIQKARQEFVKRNPTKALDEKQWDNAKFLDKAKLTINGKITNTALILLGREEAEHYLGSAVKMRWILRNMQEQNLGSEVYSIPFILNVDKVFAKIRNLNYIYTKVDTLFPEEMPRYDVFTIREPLHNAIAHQDYEMKGYINLIEYENDHLVFSNLGHFLPSSVQDVVLKDTPHENYRNPYLVAAMKNLNMIETEGGGIRKIFHFQRERLFPMPDYDFTDEKVKVTITGKILDEEFARILIKNPTLSLGDIILLDKVQKQKTISDTEFKYLKRVKFIEGRKNNNYLSYKVIMPTSNEKLKAEYMANRSFDDGHFKEMILEYLKKFGQTKRSAIDNLIIPKLSAALNDSQKKSKVGNMLSILRMEEKIRSLPGYFWESV
jgi:ATP-dependent DNA helicase RecG